MPRKKNNALPDMVRGALDSTNLPWRLETGHGHNKVFLNGALVGVIGKKDKASRRATRNLVAQIRRAAKEKGESNENR